MKRFAERLVSIEREMAQEKGDFFLFGLFLRAESAGLWDLLVAAPWIGEPHAPAIASIVDHLRPAAAAEDLIKISRVVIIPKDSPALLAITKAIKTKHSFCEVRDSEFFGWRIRHAYIITSQKPPVVRPSVTSRVGAKRKAPLGRRSKSIIKAVAKQRKEKGHERQGQKEYH